jgi:hypothetical protein
MLKILTPITLNIFVTVDSNKNFKNRLIGMETNLFRNQRFHFGNAEKNNCAC